MKEASVPCPVFFAEAQMLSVSSPPRIYAGLHGSGLRRSSYYAWRVEFYGAVRGDNIEMRRSEGESSSE